ncbi:MAG: 2-oxoacid:acceptor oxidoreductase subunit alpha [Elusimicrobiota bacterium]
MMRPEPQEIESVTIRFAGDSGDGIQLTGGQFASSTAIAGSDVSTLPDYPAEIRAPAGTVAGVSGYQLCFGSSDVLTPGDRPQVLVAFNPAALKANLKDLQPGGAIIANSDAFTPGNLAKANLASNPLEDKSLASYRVIALPMAALTRKAVEEFGLKGNQVERCKNFFALGVLFWLFSRPLEPTLAWIERKFKRSPVLSKANTRALQAGWSFAETTEIFERHYSIKKAKMPPGRYRDVTGNEATALGLAAASRLSGLPLFYASYPITPASDILHQLSSLKGLGIKTFQTEDEIAAMCAALGAAFGGHMAVTGTSGPGLALKSEAMGLGVMTELPVVIVDVQRGGPSTGLPTKTEQADLLFALFGRSGECPLPVLAPSSPADCFPMVMEACRLAVKYRHPVLFLTDGFIANGSEPWRVPRPGELPAIEASLGHERPPSEFRPYLRDPRTLARPWVAPGTPGCEHRIGGLEKQHISGTVSYDPENHEFMTRLRAEKVAKMAQDIPLLEIVGPASGKVLVVGWGSTYGAITTAVRELQTERTRVSSVHLRHLNPLPPDLVSLMSRFDKVLVPELNLGQLSLLLRAKTLLPVESLCKVRGQPFRVAEIKEKVRTLMVQRVR